MSTPSALEVLDKLALPRQSRSAGRGNAMALRRQEFAS